MAGPLLRRRGLIVASTGLAGSLALGPGWTSAAVSALTPAQTEGPFYPVRLPDDRDADLVRVTGSDAAALGVVTHVQGRVLDRAGRPMGGITVEIWQCDANGRYRHPRDRRAREQDPGFQGYGRAITDAAGGYRFRTIRPVAYSGRTPHIHFKLGIARVELLTTQMYVAGDPGNEHDPLLSAIPSLEDRRMLLVELAPGEQIEAGALTGTFDIVIRAH